MTTTPPLSKNVESAWPWLLKQVSHKLKSFPDDLTMTFRILLLFRQVRLARQRALCWPLISYHIARRHTFSLSSTALNLFRDTFFHALSTSIRRCLLVFRRLMIFFLWLPRNSRRRWSTRFLRKYPTSFCSSGVFCNPFTSARCQSLFYASRLIGDRKNLTSILDPSALSEGGYVAPPDRTTWDINSQLLISTHKIRVRK